MNQIQECFVNEYKLMTISLSTGLNRLLGIIVAFLVPISGILLTVGISIFADTIIGLWKSYKLKEKITSRKLSQIISKMLLYQMTIILFYMIDFFILNEVIQQFFTVPLMLTKVVSLTLVSIEVFSIDENIRAVKGTGLWEAFKKLTARAKDVKSDIDDLDITKL